VTQVDGTFGRGDAIAVLGPDGAVLARGLSEYDAGECARLMGHPSRAHEELLGYAPRSALIHRDQLVLL
jgi:glutamate 5-kinase